MRFRRRRSSSWLASAATQSSSSSKRLLVAGQHHAFLRDASPEHEPFPGGAEKHEGPQGGGEVRWEDRSEGVVPEDVVPANATQWAGRGVSGPAPASGIVRWAGRGPTES